MSGWVPAFPGQRPPFRPGNQVSLGNRGPLLHGAYSLRHVEPLAAALVKEMLAEPDLDWLLAPRFRDLLWTYARTVAQGHLMEAYVATLTTEQACDSTGGQVSPMELTRRLGVRASNLAQRLGILPSIPDDVRAQIAAARKTLARRAERKALHDDLKDAMREQWYPDE